jgi:hypothetical protein
MSAIVKYLSGAIAKKPVVLKPQPRQMPKPSDNHLRQGIAPSLPGLVKVFDTAPEARGMFQEHFGIDLQALAGMSPEELGSMTDMILQAKEFMSYLPIIEQHVLDYVKAVVDYNGFVARVTKAGFAGIKEIDKGRLDIFLEMAGYKAHQEKLGRKADNKIVEIETDRDNYISLSDFTLETALKVKAAASAKAQQQVAERPVIALEQARIREIASQRTRQIKELIQYGSRGR